MAIFKNPPPTSSIKIRSRSWWTQAWAIAVLGAAGLAGGLKADPQLEKDFATTQASAEQYYLNAAAPVTRSYLPVLEKLLARANQLKDAADAAAIQAEIDRVHTEAQTAAALTAALVGTRWQWFSSANLAGDSTSYIDFYRDGVARTSWGNRVTYVIKPPASLCIIQTTPPRVWCFTVDTGKREAKADVFFSQGRELRSLRYQRAISPIEPTTPPKPAN